jgi:NAD(P)-dependent dehydrogenase (short-subunit alcohol dehydrogenase family)
MARVFITGSSDGLGLMAAGTLIQEGHSVVLHARNEQRAEEVRLRLPKAEDALIGDLSSIRQTTILADKANALGQFDSVIFNAAVGYREPQRVSTEDGLSHVFAINSLAPYILTGLLHTPERFIYLSSGLHRDGDATLKDLQWEKRCWNGLQAYSDSKFHNILLAFGIARLFPGVFTNAVTPGWVATKMGGPGANDDLSQGHLTQAWLASSDDSEAKTSGDYFYHLRPAEHRPETRRAELQDRFLEICRGLSGVGMTCSVTSHGSSEGKRGESTNEAQG